MNTYIERINGKDILLAVTTNLDKLLYSIPYEPEIIEEIYSVLHEPLKCYIEIVVYIDDGNHKELDKRVITSKSTLDESLEVLMIALGNLGHYEACMMIQRYLNGSITQ